jgi:hypothetical protein
MFVAAKYHERGMNMRLEKKYLDQFIYQCPIYIVDPSYEKFNNCEPSFWNDA